MSERTDHVVAMHISQENNRPSLAVRALAAALGAELDNELGSSATLKRPGDTADLHTRPAGQNRPFSVLSPPRAPGRSQRRGARQLLSRRVFVFFGKRG